MSATHIADSFTEEKRTARAGSRGSSGAGATASDGGDIRTRSASSSSGGGSGREEEGAVARLLAFGEGFGVGRSATALRASGRAGRGVVDHGRVRAWNLEAFRLAADVTWGACAEQLPSARILRHSQCIACSFNSG